MRTSSFKRFLYSGSECPRLLSVVSHIVVVQLNVWQVAKYFSPGLCCSCSILFGYACSNILTLLLFMLLSNQSV